MNVICFLHWSLCVWRVASLNHLVTLKFEKWTLVPFLIFGRTSCSNCSTSTISCHASSCREVVTSHATCIRQYYRYRWWLKDQNDELFQAHCIFFGGWRWAKESKPTYSMQTCSSQKGWFLIHKTVSIFFNLLPLSIKLCIRVEALSKCWGDENEATLHTCQLWNQIVSKTRLMIVSIESIKYTKKIQIVFWQKKNKYK